MKNVLNVGLALMVAIQTCDFAYADTDLMERIRCRNLRKKYVADASAMEYLVGPRVMSRSCGNAYSPAESHGGHAKAEAKANDSEYWQWTWTNRWFARAGKSNTSGTFLVDEIPENTKSLKQQSTKIERRSIDPISGTVSIFGLTGKLDIDSDDPLNDFAAFRISIILEDAKDTLVPPIFIEENKAFFINGQLFGGQLFQICKIYPNRFSVCK